MKLLVSWRFAGACESEVKSQSLACFISLLVYIATVLPPGRSKLPLNRGSYLPAKESLLPVLLSARAALIFLLSLAPPQQTLNNTSAAVSDSPLPPPPSRHFE